MLLSKGDIVLVPFPFTDLSQNKLRPSVVLSVDNIRNDITVCFISSQNVDIIAQDELLLDSSDSEFLGTGLKVVSKVRVSRIVTLETNLITRGLGKLGKNQIQKLNSCLKKVLKI